MATDKTEPPVGRIAVIGILSIATVIGAQFVFRSYFFTMYEAEAHRVILDRPSELLQRKRTEDDEHLRTGRPMPIEQAMASIAHGERPSEIEPRPSTVVDAMRGWGMMPRNFDPTPVPGPGQQAPAPPFDPSAVPAPGAAPTLPGVVNAPGAPVVPGTVVPPTAAPTAPTAPAAPAAPAAPVAPAAHAVPPAAAAPTQGAAVPAAPIARPQAAPAARVAVPAPAVRPAALPRPAAPSAGAAQKG